MGVWSPGSGPTSGNDTFTGDDTGESAFGGGGNDILNGNGGNDTLQGDAGNDTVNGGAGDDTLYIASLLGEGVDTIDGGEGHDTLFFYTSGATGQSLSLAGQGASGTMTGGGTYTNIETMQLHGGAGDDQIFGADIDTVFVGNAGNDTLVGGSAADFFYAGTGNNTVNGGAGDDGISFDSPFSAYTIEVTGGTVSFTGADSSVTTVSNVERFFLGNQFYTFDALALLATNYPIETIQSTGNSDNRVDIVFLGDGYTAAQIDTTYVGHVQGFLDYLFGSGRLSEPFNRYVNYFNIHIVDVISNESGADDPTAGVVRDTALGSSYRWDGVTQRLLYVNSNATAVLDSALVGTNIDPEMRFVVVNDTQYGGGGGYFGVYAGGNTSAYEVAIHEIGHSFAGLADEYSYTETAYTGADQGWINLTTDPEGGRWQNWIGYVDPVLGTVGAYAGGAPGTSGVYRPTLASRMRVLNAPFDPIARERFVLTFYTLVDPLDAWTDNIGTKFNLSSVSVDVIDPTIISIDWTIDGQVFHNIGETLDLSTLGFGSHTITARAFDPTDWVRGDRSSLEQTVTWTVVNNLLLVGTGLGETLTGDGNAQRIEGLGGDDTLNALGGADILLGGDGNDRMDGGAGVDSMTGGLGDDVYVVDDVGDTVVEDLNGGADRVEASITYTLGANVENLTLLGSANLNGTGNALANAMIGNAGNNSLFGGTGNDQLSGEGGNDRLDGSIGDDTLRGGLGDDIYVIDAAGDVAIEDFGAGLDRVDSSVSYTLGGNIENLVLAGTTSINGTGNFLANVMVGNAGANNLFGGTGNDTLFGNDGNDRLDGSTGDDTLKGGFGDDIYIVDSVGDVVTDEFNGGLDRIDASISYALGSNVENLVLAGTANINGSGNFLANTIVGNAGNNNLFGGTGNDTLFGNDGNDRLDGSTGDDILKGGFGDDIYIVDSVGDVVTDEFNGGLDRVDASVSYTLGSNVENLVLAGTASLNGTGNFLANTMVGNSGANSLYGGTGDDVLFGNDGNDRLDGATGNDTMKGGLGDDIYIVDSVSDTTTEDVNQGTDRIDAFVSFTIGVNIENMVLQGTGNINGTGNFVNNTIIGNSGDNILAGLGGNDTLLGGAGNDQIDGSNGNDRLTGGAGADKFVFATALNATGVDQILDFNVAEDQIWLDHAVFTAIGTGVLAASAFTTGSTAADASDRVIYDPTTGALYYDADGSGGGAAVQIATLSTGLALTAASIFGI
jgi:Ca2+-binding RTX toxin-like protein